ncbi:hypothetical protein GCM10010358_68000 [Streptomyces minutiscleroticus]|uniref:Uncharacterized protein n=1 Tax=Streptomyces minutiscleroticus TaxID=68238 RepID=A0A918NY92_9ACTN|nr:hypothetical protein [Streptomyces minutiscleroticus]GGY04919.1 hypothetical protein GCM10010358_68000 [Streptomyces minutiscleroticus]
MKPHAEMDEVWPRDGRIRLVGRFHGLTGPAAGGWELLLVRRDDTGRSLSHPVRVRGGRFEGELPVTDLAAAGTAGTAAVAEWDVHLTDGTVRLRAGRRLDDIRGKKKIMVFPEQSVPEAGGFRVRPYYTVKDNLSLECRAGGPS